MNIVKTIPKRAAESGHRKNRSLRMWRRTLVILVLWCALLPQSNAWNLLHAPEMSFYRMFRRVASASDPSPTSDFAARVQNDVLRTSMNVDDKEDTLEGTRTARPVNAPVNALVNGAGNEKKRPGPSPNYDLVRQVVASSDGKLPNINTALPPRMLKGPPLFEKLDAIYHAVSHEETRGLHYMERDRAVRVFDEQEEERLVSVLRNSLEDAGFELLNRRDIDLCEALNAGYLLRLSIAPDVSGFDPSIAREFYPERFNEDGQPMEDFPFDGRVLLYRRGYSSEVTEGRIMLRKLDYLQATVVQRSARGVTRTLGEIERQAFAAMAAISRHVQVVVRRSLADIADRVPSTAVSGFLRNKWGWEKVDPETLAHDDEDLAKIGFFRLARYGGSKNRFMGSPNMEDALDPFLSCEVANGIGSVVNGGPDSEDESLSVGSYSCRYDAERSHDPNRISEQKNPFVLLERVSLNNVVDLASSEGRRTLVDRFFAKSQLVEPTYEEVIAIWRPIPEQPKRNPKLLPPKFIYDIAEIFEFEDKLPELDDPEPPPPPPPLEIRAFGDVPMANAPAVLPKTKLLFRPADAFVFDFITIVSFLAVFGSVRFDSPRLDLFALVSVSLWLIRTTIRYSNKLARYDLLVKKFLTSKISHRNSGALKYIARDAGTQRATRAALVHSWLTERIRQKHITVTRKSLVEEGAAGVNELLLSDKCVRVDAEAALNDLVDLDLIAFSDDGQELTNVREGDTVTETLKKTWDSVFEGKYSLKGLVERRH